MKNHIASAVLILAAAAGCSKNVQSPVSGEVLLTSYSGAPVTKTAISGDKTGGFTAEWSATDRIGVFTSAGTENAPHSISSLTDGAAKFSGTVKASDTEQTLYAYCPYSANAGSSAEETGIDLPQAQTMSGNSYDAAAAVMIAKPQTATLDSETGEIGDWRFAHLGAYFCISVSGDITAGGISADETVKSVGIRAEGQKLAGRMKVNLADGTYSWTGSADNATVTLPGGVKLSDMNAWLVTAPFALEDGTLTVMFTTENHKFSKQVRLSKKFEAGNVYTMGVKIDGSCTVEPYITVDDADLTFGINEETKTFAVHSNVDWSVRCDNSAFTAVKVDGSTLKVSATKNTGFSPRKCEVTLEGDGAQTELALTQKTLWKLSRGKCALNDDGSVTITADASEANPRLVVDNGSVTNKVDFYNMKFKIREANLTKGYLHVNTWGTNEINYQMCIGGDNRFVTGSAFNSRNVKLSKEFTADDLNGIREIAMAFEPYTPSGGQWNSSVKCIITVDGVQVLNDWGINKNPWMPGAASWKNGVDFYFGITGAEGSITIESCDFTAISRSR